MEREFKHPQIFSDMRVFCQMYYPMHNNLPKQLRFAVGERILAECLRAIVLANAVDKTTPTGCVEGLAHVRRARAAVEVIRGFLLLAWKEIHVARRAGGALAPSGGDQQAGGKMGAMVRVEASAMKWRAVGPLLSSAWRTLGALGKSQIHNAPISSAIKRAKGLMSPPTLALSSAAIYASRRLTRITVQG